MLLGNKNLVFTSNPSPGPSGTAPYKIKVGELSGSVVNLSSDGVQLDSISIDNTQDKVAEFELYDPGTYTIDVSNGGSTVWTNSITIDEIGVYWVKGRVLNNCTAAQIHEVCQAGIASKVFNLRDVWTFTDSRETPGILNNQKFYITHFFDNGDGTESIQFWLANDAISTTYRINQCRGQSTNGTSWTSYYSSVGGWKYCDLRRQFMPKYINESTKYDIYQQAMSIIPDTATLLDGIKFSELYYSDTNLKADLYTYDLSSDSFIIVSSWVSQSSNTPMFQKGYFTVVTNMTEEKFNSGYYYTMTTSGSSSSMYVKYTHATTYSSGTTYYGFYEYLQEDGVFYNGLKSLIDSGYIELMELKQLAGDSQTHSTVINDYISIPSSSELTGSINTYVEPDGTTIKLNTYYGENADNHNPKWDGVEYNDLFTNNLTWIRSLLSSTIYQFICFSTGSFSTNNVYVNYRVRPCFRFN